jgi:hypothetical protein
MNKVLHFRPPAQRAVPIRAEPGVVIILPVTRIPRDPGEPMHSRIRRGVRLMTQRLKDEMNPRA